MKGKLNPAFQHGEALRGAMTNEYRSWEKMLRRCRPNNKEKAKYYFDRGIRVCARWRSSYVSFLADMGRKPSPLHTLERIDNDGPYSPVNCRWATIKEQTRNRRTTKFVTHAGRTASIAEWAEITGINQLAIAQRLRTGWEPERALYTPTHTYHGRTK